MSSTNRHVPALAVLTLAVALALGASLAQPLAAQDSLPGGAPEAAAPPVEPSPAAAPAGDAATAPQAVQTAVQSQQPGQASAAAVDSLLDRVRERFQVYPVPQGVMLLPKYVAPQVQSVQVADGTIAINGRPAAGGEIASLLGEDAALVLRLSYLPPAELAERAATAPGEPDGMQPGRGPATGSIADTDDAADASTQPEPGEPAESTEPEESEESEETAGEEDLDLDLDMDSSSGDIVKWGGSITVEEGETVTGDVVGLMGPVDIKGQVLGDVVSVMGPLHLWPTARVNGDAVSVGGPLERDAGAQVLGESTTVGITGPNFRGNWVWGGNELFGALGSLLLTLIWIALLLILGSIFILFFNRPLERVETNLRSSILKAGVVGFLAQLLFLPAYVIGLVLLTITIIGIPIAVLWAVGFFIVGFVAAIFGFTAVARSAGEVFANRMARPLHSAYVALLVGLIVLFSLTLLGNIFNLGPGFMDVFGVMFLVMGFLVLYLAFTVGFGSVILTRFGTRTTWSGESPAGSGEPLAPVPPSPPYGPAPGPEYRPAPELPGEPVPGGANRPMLASAAGEGGSREPQGPERNDSSPRG